MLEEQHSSPLGWLQAWALNMGWPVCVMASFWLGRYVSALEHRVAKAEDNMKLLLENIKQLSERHMPAIHRALAELRGLLMGGR